MKIFINVDTYKEVAIDTKRELENVCSSYDIEIVDNASEADMIFSIGGDGTFLESARLSNGIPVIGINCGTLGFLTDVNPDDLEETIANILDGKYYIEERMMLEGKIIKENG